MQAKIAYRDKSDQPMRNYTAESTSALDMSLSYGSSPTRYDDRLYRSQANIEHRMKQDFERLQKQVRKRMDREKKSNELVKFNIEELKWKAHHENEKVDAILKASLDRRKK